MIIGYYLLCLILSAVLSVAFVSRWNQRTNINISIMFTIIPIIQVGYFLLILAGNEREALLAIKMTYFAGTFLLPFITLAIADLLNYHFSARSKTILIGIAMLFYGAVLTIGHSDLFYSGFTMETIDGAAVLHKEYGPVHTLYYVYIIICLLIGIFLIFYQLVRKRSFSRKTLAALLSIELISGASYFLTKLLPLPVDPLPATYTIFQLIFMGIMNRASLMDISVTQASALAESNDNGFMALDRQNRFIGANETAVKMFPEIDELEVDRVPHFAEGPLSDFNERLAIFNKDREKPYEYEFKKDDRYYKVIFYAIHDRGRIRGVQVIIDDETKEKVLEEGLRNYNDRLNREVEEKTDYIQSIQNKMILGLADMVENRDTNTGGHIKRTSDVVNILIAEMLKDEEPLIDRNFGKMMVKAAPMHDLGKIAIDDAVLRKPGRYTDEEFAIMKTHAPKGAEIVRKVLEGTQDESFASLAENVAHYHHERYDGSGYPDHLKGDEIPLEARIMAIADVYDALVSKRCYKEAMSYDQAYQIIEDGMGRQFDPKLNRYFLVCHEKLEDYYRSLEDQPNSEGEEMSENYLKKAVIRKDDR